MVQNLLSLFFDTAVSKETVQSFIRNNNLEGIISEGNFSPLTDWMRRNVHSYASLFETEELIEAATGRPLDTADFKEHLLVRYG